MPVPPVREPRGKQDLAPDPPELTLFARIENLVGEEAALLTIPARERSKQQHDRLHVIGEELDRLWDKLRERAERLTHREPPGEAAS